MQPYDMITEVQLEISLKESSDGIAGMLSVGGTSHVSNEEYLKDYHVAQAFTNLTGFIRFHRICSRGCSFGFPLTTTL